VKVDRNIREALTVLAELGLPRAQQNQRSALCLLALLNLGPEKRWNKAESPLIGITPMMDFSKDNYRKPYAPNTRETFRRQTMHQFVAAGIALYNPDDPARPVNSPKTVYQIEPDVLALLRSYRTPKWKDNLSAYLSTHRTLASRYAKERKLNQIPVKIPAGATIRLTPGEHNLLSKAVIEDFAPCFVPGSTLVYAGDTGDKWAYFDEALVRRLGVSVNSHGKMPDVVLHYGDENWLLLIECVTSHGPVNAKRHEELAVLFSASSAPLVFVTAFPNRAVMARHLAEIAWETEVWCADSPSHVIHFNGVRFLGPYNA
jgi:hypothetical protein